MTMRPRLLAPLSLALLAGCVSTPTPPRTVGTRTPIPTIGLERVMGHNAATLAALFGEADQDVREGPGRRLQFVGPVCVLDAYLYPQGSGREPVVTHVDSRRPDGEDIDRASCVAALTRRPAAR